MVGWKGAVCMCGGRVRAVCVRVRRRGGATKEGGGTSALSLPMVAASTAAASAFEKGIVGTPRRASAIESLWLMPFSIAPSSARLSGGATRSG
jgi:hypothetical protein